MGRTLETDAPLQLYTPSVEQIGRVHDLSDMQRQCVALVLIGPSKLIAQRLGISHHTVDQHLKEACRRLGVTSRAQAAAILATAETAKITAAPPPPQAWGDHAPPVADSDAPAMIGTSDRQIDAGRERDRVSDAGLVGLGALPPIVTEQPRTQGGKTEQAGLVHTLKRVLAYALAMAILAAAAVSIGDGFNDIGNFIEIHVRHH